MHVFYSAYTVNNIILYVLRRITEVCTTAIYNTDYTRTLKFL